MRQLLFHTFRDTVVAFLRLFAILLLIAGFIYLRGCLQRPPRTPLTTQLSDDVSYQRIIKDDPHAMVVHVVDVTLSAETALFMNYPDWPNFQLPYLAKKTSTFVEETGALLAINAGYFTPFRPGVPFYFYPRTGNPVMPIGLLISQGDLIEPADTFKELCISRSKVVILDGACPPETEFAVAGNEWLIQNGEVAEYTPNSYNTRLYPRTAVAVSEDGSRVWLIVVDGLQRGYSEGATLTELQQLGVELGAANLINLDGGGSSTLAINEQGKAMLANATFHTWIPMRERPIANFIAVWVEPDSPN